MSRFAEPFRMANAAEWSAKRRFGLGAVAGWMIWLLLVLPAGAEPSASSLEEMATQETGSSKEEGETAPDEHTLCFDFVWDTAHADPWYLDAAGRRIIPEVTRDWLAIYFRPPGDTDLEEQLGDEPHTGFDRRYAELFDYRLELPGPEPGRMFYRLRQGLPFGAFDSFFRQLREDPSVQYVRPVWRIQNQLYAPPEEIDVVWKTVVMPEERQQLLETAGALEGGGEESVDTERIRINPCRRAPWQAANLLAQDLRVTSAVPRLIKIETPVEIRFDLETQGALTGAPIPFRLEIHFSEGIEIESGTLANLTFKPTGIFQNLYEVNFDQPLSGLELHRSPIVVTGHLLIYAPGETVIPPVSVYFTDSRTATELTASRTASSKAMPVRIAALIPEMPGEYRLKVASPALTERLTLSGPARHKKTALTMLLTGLVLLSLALLSWLRLRPRLAPEKEFANLEKQQPLAGWLARNPSTMRLEDCAAFGADVKEYLAGIAGLPPEARGGSHAFFLQKLENHLSEGDQKRAARLLRGIDHLLASGDNIEEQIPPLFEQAKTLLASMETHSPAKET